MGRANNPDNPHLPSAQAAEFARILLHRMEKDGERFVMQDRQTEEIIELDEEVFELFKHLLQAMGSNQAVSIMPVGHELTTHQAAQMLNVSRGHLVKLVDNGEIGHRMVGTHRRIRLEDLMDYKNRSNQSHQEALDELAKESEELGLYD